MNFTRQHSQPDGFISGSSACVGGLPSRTSAAALILSARRKARPALVLPGFVCSAPILSRRFGVFPGLLIAASARPARFFCRLDVLPSSPSNHRGRRLAWWLAWNGGLRRG